VECSCGDRQARLGWEYIIVAQGRKPWLRLSPNVAWLASPGVPFPRRASTVAVLEGSVSAVARYLRAQQSENCLARESVSALPWAGRSGAPHLETALKVQYTCVPRRCPPAHFADVVHRDHENFSPGRLPPEAFLG